MSDDKPDACAVNYADPGKYPSYKSPEQSALLKPAYDRLTLLDCRLIEGRYQEAEVLGYQLAKAALDLVLQARKEQGLK